MNTHGHCCRCNLEFQPGDVRYVLNVESFADVDLEPEGIDISGDDSGSESVEALLSRMDSMDAEELESQVHERIRLVLCKSCRDSVSGSLKKIQTKQPSSPSHQVH